MPIRPWILTTAALLSLSARPSAAQTTEIRVFTSNGIRAVMEELRPQCERAAGRPLAFEFNSSSGFKQKIDAGEAFDVAIVSSELMDELVKEKKILSNSSAGIARCGIGIGVRSGAPKPDIGTSAALKQAFLKAKSITYAQDGASAAYIVKMFDRLGISSAVQPKIILEQGSGRATARVADGSAEIVITLGSEILPVKGIQLVGPLPADLQNYVSFSAGVAAKTSNAQAASALVRFLAGPNVTPTLRAKGMEPLK
jgi:molybdate transport system substrate-binding protein